METQDAASTSSLIDVLVWTTDAPAYLRRTALETAVSVLLMAEMPVAARAAVVRVAPPNISETTQILLSWATSNLDQLSAPLPPTHGESTARDVAFRLFSQLHAQGIPAEQAATSAQALLPDDVLLTRWSAWLSQHCQHKEL